MKKVKAVVIDYKKVCCDLQARAAAARRQVE
jgi:hypothetical protein